MNLLSIGSLLSLLKPLGNVLKNLFLGFFLVKAGADKQKLKDIQKEQKNVEKVKHTTNRVNSLSDSDLDKLLDG